MPSGTSTGWRPRTTSTSSSRIASSCRRSPEDAVPHRVDDLLATATRHKHEIDYTLRHWATPVERARVEDRLGSLMRIGLRLREVREGPSATPARSPCAAA